MIKRILLLLTISSALLSAAPGWGSILVGVEMGTFNLAKESEGVYRSFSSNANLKYTEELGHFGFGPVFDFGFAPGRASLRLSPFLGSGSVSKNTAGFKEATYDLLGFTQSQTETLNGQSQPMTITHDVVGTEILFKYNAPSDIPADNPTLKVLRKIVRVSNPWFGLGPMGITYTRVVTVGSGDNKEFARQSYMDFNFVVAFGLQFDLNEIYNKIPKNIFILMHFGFITNLTPDADFLVQDDNMNISESGNIFKFGVAYDL